MIFSFFLCVCGTMEKLRVVCVPRLSLSPCRASASFHHGRRKPVSLWFTKADVVTIRRLLSGKQWMQSFWVLKISMKQSWESDMKSETYIVTKQNHLYFRSYYRLKGFFVLRNSKRFICQQKVERTKGCRKGLFFFLIFEYATPFITWKQMTHTLYFTQWKAIQWVSLSCILSDAPNFTNSLCWRVHFSFNNTLRNWKKI